MKTTILSAIGLLALAGSVSAQTAFLATGTGISNGTPSEPPPQTFYALDVATCSVSTVGTMGDSITAMDFDNAGNLVGIRATDFTPPYTLYSIDTGSGALTSIIDLTDGGGDPNVGNFPDMAFDPTTGNWYAWTESGDDLTQVDPGTGVVTVLGDAYPGNNPSAGSGTSVDSSGTIWTIPCSGCGDGARAGNGNGEERGGVIADALYTVDPTTGLASFVVQLTGEDTNFTINGMDFASDGTLYAIEGGFCNDTNCATRLVSIDTTSGAITEVCPQAALPTGVDAVAIAGLPASVAVPLMNHWMFLAIALLLGSVAAVQVWRRQG
ncbi:hypothetical protein HFP89_06975 [Wenzhouxiangella sp. XN79A]|uniref:hypothetical protein n=1 Tax=Wenzhouxiangella sp. XN79A TaxID=2724193 RepID=UPI00144AA406|nr:hypothetical protein [Wenzhouxiangella sp. XN79A]NKI34903.1 hypothetical protein [Wenzhouxiangella sp. XN79A]